MDTAAQVAVIAPNRFADRGCTGRDSSRERRHRVFDIEMDVGGSPCRVGRPAADHDDGVIDSHFRVHERSVRPIEPADHGTAERGLEERDETFGFSTDEVRTDEGYDGGFQATTRALYDEVECSGGF